MAIDATKGLPSFSEMYAAYKNRASLGDALQSGLQGYEKGVGMAQQGEKISSEADYHRAQAEALRNKTANPTKDMFDVRTLENVLSPEQYAIVKNTATPGADGGLYITKDEARSLVSVAGQKSTAHSADVGHGLTAKGQKIEGIKEKLAPVLKVTPPGIMEQLGGMAAKGVGKAVGMVSPTAGAATTSALTPGAVTAEQQRNALFQQLDQATGASATPPPTAEPNYASEAAALQAGHKKGDRVKINGQMGTLQ